MPNSIGMSVPGSSSLMGANDQSLGDQVAGETAEERKRRLQKLQAARQTAPGMSAITGTAPGGGYGGALGTS